MFGRGPFGKALDVAAQVTGGVCPTCNHETMFVSLSPEIYRCMNCGTDCRQYINGSIKYLRTIATLPDENKNVKPSKMGG